MQIGTHFCQAIYKGIEGSEWEELYHHHRDMSKAGGAKKTKRESEGKGAVGYEGSQRQGGMNSVTQPAKKTFGKETDKTGVVGRTSQRPNHSFGQSFEVRGRISIKADCWLEAFREVAVSMTCG